MPQGGPSGDDPRTGGARSSARTPYARMHELVLDAGRKGAQASCPFADHGVAARLAGGGTSRRAVAATAGARTRSVASHHLPAGRREPWRRRSTAYVAAVITMPEPRSRLITSDNGPCGNLPAHKVPHLSRA